MKARSRTARSDVPPSSALAMKTDSAPPPKADGAQTGNSSPSLIPALPRFWPVMPASLPRPHGHVLRTMNRIDGRRFKVGSAGGRTDQDLPPWPYSVSSLRFQ